MKLYFLFALLIGAVSGNVVKLKNLGYDCEYCQPEQIHIAFGEKTNDIVVTWTTFNDTSESRVQFGQGVMDQEANGTSTVFIDGGKEARRQFIHTVTLKDLKFETTYVYHAGSIFAWSERFSFKTPPQGEGWTVRAAIYGDMGSENAHSLPYLQDEAERNKFDVILHVGDFAYDMDSDEARVGDQFMRQIQPLAAIVPYMTCPGNHENAYNFSNYANRFSMPGPASSLFYSFDLGPVHFISISTEVYYFIQYGIKLVQIQYDWLDEDLKKANLPENRSKRPWIVLFGHRPMYCSNSNDIDCSFEYTRMGLLGYYALEPLLMKYGVDLVIWAHEHSYERTWPLYDNKVYNGSYEQPYVNPGAPVHIVTGSAGCKEDTDPFNPDPKPWSAYRNSHYGFTRFVAQNNTHLYMEQVDVQQKGKVIDSFWLVKEQHLPFNINAPVHIITGSAGCKEGRDHYLNKEPKWSAFRSQDYGYTKFKAFNKTHIYLEQKLSDNGNHNKKVLAKLVQNYVRDVVTIGRRGFYSYSLLAAWANFVPRIAQLLNLPWTRISIDLDGQAIDSFWLIKDKRRFSSP